MNITGKVGKEKVLQFYFAALRSSFSLDYDICQSDSGGNLTPKEISGSKKCTIFCLSEEKRSHYPGTNSSRNAFAGYWPGTYW